MGIAEESPIVLSSVIVEEVMEGLQATARIRIEYVIGRTTSQSSNKERLVRSFTLA